MDFFNHEVIQNDYFVTNGLIKSVQLQNTDSVTSENCSLNTSIAEWNQDQPSMIPPKLEKRIKIQKVSIKIDRKPKKNEQKFK